MSFLGVSALPTTPEAVYGAIIGFAMLVLLLFNLTIRTLSLIMSSSILHFHIQPFILSHILYARSNYRFPGFRSISRPHSIFATLYYIVTGFFNCFGIHSTEHAGIRAAKLSLINLIPMFLGGGYEFGARLIGVSLGSYGFLHRLFASVAFLEATTHVIIICKTKGVSLEDQVQVYGVLAASVLLALIFLPFIKRRVYEVFHFMHIACAATLVYAIWQHCRLVKSKMWIFAMAYTITFFSTGALQVIRIIYRNVVLGKSHVRLNAQTYAGDVALINLSLPKPWTVRAGQRINLGVPIVGIFYIFQTHPFTISWWENDLKGRAISISVLFRPRSGFTRRLFDHVKPNQGCGAWVDGPFGPSSVGWKVNGRFGDYGHVFLVTTGIGIAAHLPYIKELLDGHDKAEVPTQRISLVWQLDEMGDWESARDLLQMLVRQDNGYVSVAFYHTGQVRGVLIMPQMLRVSVYDTLHSQIHSEVQHIGDNKLISLHSGHVNWEEQLDSEIGDHVGKMLVSGLSHFPQATRQTHELISPQVAAQDGVRLEIRNLVRSRVYKGVELFETEFQPWGQSKGLWTFFRP